MFVDENEDLTIFPVVYDSVTGVCRFETTVTGNFVIVGTDVFGSDRALYEACRTSEQVRVLIALLRLLAFWS